MRQVAKPYPRYPVSHTTSALPPYSMELSGVNDPWSIGGVPQSEGIKQFEPVREKTNNLGFRPGLTQTGLYNHRRWLEAGNFVFK